MSAFAGAGHRADIDGLRAVAVLAVLTFHAAPDRLPGGFAGVDAFFVISGYLIAGLLRAEAARGPVSLSAFWERRARRLMPALFAVLAASCIAAAVLLAPRELEQFGFALRGASVFGANFALAQMVDYFSGPAERQALLHLWSLGVEEQFYLVFPLLLVGLLRWGDRGARWGLAALAAVSFALAAAQGGSERAFFMPHLRAWELLAGALLGLGAVPAFGRRARAAAGAAGAAGAASGVLAWASWRWIEQPFRRPGAVVGRRGVFALTAAGCAAFLALGYAAKWTRGAPERFGPEARAVIDARTAYFEGEGRACARRSDAVAQAAEGAAAAAAACRLGPEGPVGAVLWGDSLAMALHPAAAEAAQAAGVGLRVMTRPNCPPLPGFQRREDAKQDLCRAFNDQVRAAIRAEDARTVILLGHFAPLLEGEGAEARRADLLALAGSLTAEGRRLLLLEPAPAAGADVPTEAFRALRFGGPLPEGPPRAGHLAGTEALRAVFAEAGARHGAGVVASAPLFCPGPVCEVLEGGLPLYSDATHPSPLGARRWVPALTEALRAAREG